MANDSNRLPGIAKYRMTPARIAGTPIATDGMALHEAATEAAQYHLAADLKGYAYNITDVQVWGTKSGKSVMVQFTYELAPEDAECQRAQDQRDCPAGHRYIAGVPYHKSMDSHFEALAWAEQQTLPRVEGFDIESKTAGGHHLSITKLDGRTRYGVAILKPGPRGWFIYCRNDLGSFATAQAAAEFITNEWNDNRKDNNDMTTAKERATGKATAADTIAEDPIVESVTEEAQTADNVTPDLPVSDDKSDPDYKWAQKQWSAVGRNMTKAAAALQELVLNWQDGKGVMRFYGNRSIQSVARERFADDAIDPRRVLQMLQGERIRYALGSTADDVSERALRELGNIDAKTWDTEQARTVVTNIKDSGKSVTAKAVKEALGKSTGTGSAAATYLARAAQPIAEGAVSNDDVKVLLSTIGQYVNMPLDAMVAALQSGIDAA